VIKAAAIPGSTIGPISVPFRGRVIKVAGDRTFESWTITVINDTDYGLRSAFENWMNKINKVSDNTGLVTPLDYQADAFVYQMDRDGSTLRAYKMYSVFPTSVAPMPLSYESTDVIQEFTVELQVQWVEAYVGNSPIALGEDIV
jgi:hypothetical protein